MILPKSLLNDRLSPSRTNQTSHVHRRDQHILHERHERRGPLERNAPRSVVYLKYINEMLASSFVKNPF